MNIQKKNEFLLFRIEMNDTQLDSAWFGSSSKRNEITRAKKKWEESEARVSLDFSLGMYCIYNCEGDRCFTKQTNIMKSYMRTMDQIIIIFFLLFLRCCVCITRTGTHVSALSWTWMNVTEWIGKKDEIAKRKQLIQIARWIYDSHTHIACSVNSVHHPTNDTDEQKPNNKISLMRLSLPPMRRKTFLLLLCTEPFPENRMNSFHFVSSFTNFFFVRCVSDRNDI